MAQSERQLKEGGFHHDWTLNQTIELLRNPKRIPYLGCFEYVTETKTRKPEVVSFLPPREKESELSVRNYHAMLEMLRDKDQEVNLTVFFRNLGLSGIDGLGPFLSIYSRTKNTKEGISFAVESGLGYVSYWLDKSFFLNRVEQRMQDFRGPNIR